jgi:hypothetical protein
MNSKTILINECTESSKRRDKCWSTPVFTFISQGEVYTCKVFRQASKRDRGCPEPPPVFPPEWPRPA